MTDDQFGLLMQELRDMHALLAVLAGSVLADVPEVSCDHPVERRVQTAARWQTWMCQECGFEHGLSES